MTERLWRILGLNGKERLLGISFVVLVSFIWVIASFLVQNIEETGVHPVVVTYVSNSLFALYFPIFWVGQSLRRIQTGDDGSSSAVIPSYRDWKNDPKASMMALMGNELFRAACQVAPLWFLAQLAFNISLSKTSVTSNTILSSASSLFTFVFSVLLLSERFTYFKLSCIVALIAGTAMVTYSDATAQEEGSPSSLVGDAMCLISAILYGLYTVSLRKKIHGDDASVPMTLFFGMMGMLIACLIGPILGITALLGVHFGTFSWKIFGILILKGCLDNVLSDYLWARSILLIGPTLATSGLALQVPIAIISDALLKHPVWIESAITIVFTLVGGAVILAAFFGLNLNDQQENVKTPQDTQESETLVPSIPRY